MYIGIGTVVLNVIFIFILIKPLALGGLALASSISITCGYLIMLLLLRKKLGRINGKRIVNTGIKLIFASSIMGVLVYGLYMWTVNKISAGTVSDIIILSVNGAAGALIYYLIIRGLKIEEVDWVVSKLKARFSRT
jgi:putative peptidoglycan lipid II flippase